MATLNLETKGEWKKTYDGSMGWHYWAFSEWYTIPELPRWGMADIIGTRRPTYALGATVRTVVGPKPAKGDAVYMARVKVDSNQYIQGPEAVSYAEALAWVKETVQDL